MVFFLKSVCFATSITGDILAFKIRLYFIRAVQKLQQNWGKVHHKDFLCALWCHTFIASPTINIPLHPQSGTSVTMMSLLLPDPKPMVSITIYSWVLCILFPLLICHKASKNIVNPEPIRRWWSALSATSKLGPIKPFSSWSPNNFFC